MKHKIITIKTNYKNKINLILLIIIYNVSKY